MLLGAGLPFAFTGTGLAGTGVPRNGEALLAAT
jgi:hypothetical protein